MVHSDLVGAWSTSPRTHVALYHGCNKIMHDRRLVRLHNISPPQSVLHVSHDPWTFTSSTMIQPTFCVSEVDRFHGSGAIVKIISLCIAIVETTSIVVIFARSDHVH